MIVTNVSSFCFTNVFENIFIQAPMTVEATSPFQRPPRLFCMYVHLTLCTQYVQVGAHHAFVPLQLNAVVLAIKITQPLSHHFVGTLMSH